MKTTLTLIMAAMVILSGCAQQATPKQTMMKKENSAMINQEKMMEKETNTEENMISQGNLLAGTTSPYREFTKADYDNALAEGKVILLYFYASWCPLCKAEQQETFAAFNELQEENIIGFRVNYKDSDTGEDEEALAKEFGVTYQHTKVILKDGKRILKAPDSWDKQRYLDELKNVV
mgnify:CR=1 FL=1